MITQAHIVTLSKPYAACAGACTAVWSMAMKRSLRRVGNQPRLYSFTNGMGSNTGNLMTRMFARGAPRPA
ncbi:MAG: hypothetical protein JNL19_08490 [Burkholderiales bacterium]|nr:hypothetical protein [Burkholderiales bacterium]